MPRILIACPKTGKPLSTSMSADPTSFASMSLMRNTIGPCPHCNEAHTWDKKDSWLEGQESGPQKP